MIHNIDEEFDEDDMPCMCDCGQWFDLNDGKRSKRNPGKVICRKCAKEEKEICVGDSVEWAYNNNDGYHSIEGVVHKTSPGFLTVKFKSSKGKSYFRKLLVTQVLKTF